jgi:hypothetical protein
MAIQDDIDVLQAQIDAIKGDVSGVPPASCNIIGLKDVITELEEQIKDLRISQVEEDNPFDGTTMTLRRNHRTLPALLRLRPTRLLLISRGDRSSNVGAKLLSSISSFHRDAL